LGRFHLSHRSKGILYNQPKVGIKYINKEVEIANVQTGTSEVSKFT